MIGRMDEPGVLPERVTGSFSEQWALLFRDYLRSDLGGRRARGGEAPAGQRVPGRSARYTDAKAPFM